MLKKYRKKKPVYVFNAFLLTEIHSVELKGPLSDFSCVFKAIAYKKKRRTNHKKKTMRTTVLLRIEKRKVPQGTCTLLAQNGIKIYSSA